MMHTRRRWSIAEVGSAEELANLLTAHTWTLCAAFLVAGTPYVFLNDATSEDGAQEYGALKVTGEGRFVQVESITFSWCTEERALEHSRGSGSLPMQAGGVIVP
jgi:hypothetical protein